MSVFTGSVQHGRRQLLFRGETICREFARAKSSQNQLADPFHRLVDLTGGHTHKDRGSHCAFPHAGQLMQEQERMIAQAREEQNRILKEAAQVRDSIISNAQAQAHEEARKILDDAKVRIEAEKESALREIRSQVALLSVKVAEKVIRQDLSSDKSQMDLVYKMLDEVTAPAKDKN